MTEHFDVAVIGGGPGGLTAALTVAKAGCRVVLLEKDPEIGRPVHCAEAVTRRSFDRFIEVRPAWIQTTPTIGKLVSPAGSTLTLTHKHGCYILDRPRMEQDLAAEIGLHGGEVRCLWRGVRLRGSDPLFTSLEAVNEAGETVAISAAVFIAADGVESCLAREAGIDNRVGLEETESYLAYRLEGISVDRNVVEVHVGSRIAPRSYAWVFPVSDAAANVGLGVPSTFGPARPVRGYLDRFVESRFGGGTVTRTSCGAAIRYQGTGRLHRGNLLVVGDAARLLDSLTGGGIQLAMASGRAAAKAALTYLEDPGRSLVRLHAQYPDRFMLETDTELTRLLRIRQLVDKLSEEELDDLVTGMADYLGNQMVDEVSAWATLAGTIRKKPRILRIARHLFL